MAKQGGDRTSGKYSEKQRSDGRYYMPNNVDELICHLTSQNSDDKDIVRIVLELTSEEIDVERIESLRSTILAQRRIAWLRREKDRDDVEPATAAERIQWASQNIIRMIKSGKLDPKEKLAANRVLAELAMKEKEVSPDTNTKQNAAIDKLMGADGSATE